jgi:hypothetical protein
MQSKNGITIHVLNANTPNRLPLNVLLEGGLTLVRVPHGPFKVRVITPHPTDVTVTLDQKDLVSCQVPAGVSELAMGKDGRPLAYTSAADTARGAAPVCEEVSASGIPTEGFADDVDPELLAQTVRDGVVGGDDALANMASTQPDHITGFLVVSVKFTEQAPVPGIVPPPYDEDQVAFQMNPPADHDQMVAANFHKIVPPEKIEPRWCSCCRRHDDRK